MLPSSVSVCLTDFNFDIQNDGDVQNDGSKVTKPICSVRNPCSVSHGYLF